MLKKRVQPPYVPILKSDADTTHFDLEEVKENIDVTIEDPLQTVKIETVQDFDGFTFDGGNSTLHGTSVENSSLLLK